MAENARLFMKLSQRDSGELIAGEARVTEFAGQIELEDWSWDLSRDGAEELLARAHPRQGPTSVSEVTALPFTFSKYMDRSTPSILSAMAADKLLKAEIVLEEASEVEFRLVVKLDKVRVLSYGVDAEVSDNSGLVKEDWTFGYEAIQFDYTAAGGGLSTVRIERPPQARNTPGRPKVRHEMSPQARTLLDFIAWRERTATADWKGPGHAARDWKSPPPLHDD